MDNVRILEVKQSIFASNDEQAAALRAELKQEKIFLLNLMSAPGSGKTTTLRRTIAALQNELRIGVMEADIDSDVDARTIAETGVRAIQLHTGGMCHLDAGMTQQGLRELGISKLVMMTGDNEKTARSVAEAVGLTEFHAGVLPEDKANYIRAEHAAGRKVIMLGDGINDSPALSAADVGIAISDGAAIAREIADITIAADSLRELVTLKAIANGLQHRTRANYRFIMSFNSMLIVLGAMGILPPATSALLHNASTLGVSLKSMTNLLT